MKVRHMRLVSSQFFWVDVRIASVDGKWLASADTGDGPTLGMGRLPEEAIAHALRPFDGIVEDLMDTVPDEFYWSRA